MMKAAPDLLQGLKDLLEWESTMVHPEYANAICLEHTNHGTPFTDLEARLNKLGNEALDSEDIPPTILEKP